MPPPRIACVQMFQVRGGRIVNRIGWSDSIDQSAAVVDDIASAASS